MRGKRPWRGRVPSAKRITPADAGKTRASIYAFCDCKDHPRGCGENATLRQPIGATRGSPPRMRGKLSATPHCRIQGRITPAGAGKTMKEVPCVCVDEDHPRRCGENSACTGFCTVLGGSPPQVRGKHAAQKARFLTLRITPAGAGKTVHHHAPAERGEDHPRRCGENKPLDKAAQRDSGSPPQVRGKLRAASTPLDQRGITPAGAGKTSFPFSVSGAHWDHPRRCGENRDSLCILWYMMGSPPQVRGKQAGGATRLKPYRITPAGAGKTVCGGGMCR